LQFARAKKSEPARFWLEALQTPPPAVSAQNGMARAYTHSKVTMLKEFA
jgi:hypothetical protein